MLPKEVDGAGEDRLDGVDFSAVAREEVGGDVITTGLVRDLKVEAFKFAEQATNTAQWIVDVLERSERLMVHNGAFTTIDGSCS